MQFVSSNVVAVIWRSTTHRRESAHSTNYGHSVTPCVPPEAREVKGNWSMFTASPFGRGYSFAKHTQTVYLMQVEYPIFARRKL